jgi:hypothetical protein
MQEPSFFKSGMTGGVLISLFANIHTNDVVKTVLLAATGTIVSVIVSFLMNRLLQKKR